MDVCLHCAHSIHNCNPGTLISYPCSIYAVTQSCPSTGGNAQANNKPNYVLSHFPCLQPSVRSMSSDTRVECSTLCLLECVWHFKQPLKVQNTKRWEEQLVNVIHLKAPLEHQLHWHLKTAICLWLVHTVCALLVCLCCDHVCVESKPLLPAFGLLHAGRLTYGSEHSQGFHLIGSLQGTLMLPCIPYCNHLLHWSMPVNFNHTHNTLALFPTHPQK